MCLLGLLGSVACGPAEAPPPRAEPTPERLALAPSPPVPVEAVEPVERGGGPWTEELTLDSAPFDTPGAPSAIVHASPDFAPDAPLRLAFFLHGWDGCARQLSYAGEVPCREGEAPRPGWGLLDAFDEGRGTALFVVLQLPYLERSGSPGRFVEQDRFAGFVDELLAALEHRLGPADRTRIASVSLFAHSAGYESTMAILARGGLEVRDVVLFDALYAGEAAFAQWVSAEPHRRMVSIYVRGASTARHCAQLAHFCRSSLGEASVASMRSSDALAERVRGGHRVVIARTDVSHDTVPVLYLPQLLAPLGLANQQSPQEVLVGYNRGANDR